MVSIQKRLRDVVVEIASGIYHQPRSATIDRPPASQPHRVVLNRRMVVKIRLNETFVKDIEIKSVTVVE
jgi:hypothetical protein